MKRKAWHFRKKGHLSYFYSGEMAAHLNFMLQFNADFRGLCRANIDLWIRKIQALESKCRIVIPVLLLD